ncbi:MAG TPA: glycosyltransferase [Actinomycetota bacterium]|nr:glycosyltransferase [Actinomycetota bacterium]
MNRSSSARPLLSVVTPVYNGAGFIAENVEIIRSEFAKSGVSYELIVVSDGSVDDTAERALAAGHPEVRVLQYDRNVGKGYAVKLGLLAARGQFIGFIDSDLDLHPAELPAFLEAMERDALDAAIGSKRHPRSQVDYPTRRRVYSWLYQQLIRVLFDLDVRDTQVGMKLFRRALVNAVVPHLLVKRYAFDLELLAVANDSGFRRIEELPVRLDYGFSESGLDPLGVGQALLDTAAIFYRLRILQYYRRRRRIVGERSAVPPLTTAVAFAGPDADDEALRRSLDALKRLERAPSRVDVSLAAPRASDDDLTARRLELLDRTKTDLIAFLTPGVVPGTNWLGALLPYFANPKVVAVGGPILPRATGDLRVDGAAALYESRFAAGPLARRHLPGNLRESVDQPLDNLLVRRRAALASRAFHDAARRMNDGDVCRRLAREGSVLFVPDAAVVASMPRLVRPLLQTVHAHARARGVDLARGEGAPLSALPPVALTLALLAVPVSVRRPRLRIGLSATAALYAAGLLHASTQGALRHRSARVGLAFLLAAPASHIAYGAGVLRGCFQTLSRRH